MGGVIVWKKTIFLIIVLILSVITLGGCKMKGFNNQKEAEEFILQNLEDKYGENFDITKVKKYKEEKIGINWIQAEAKAENQDDIFQVYARNTGLFKDSYHITFFKEKLYNMIEPLCQEKKYIKKYEIDISGNLSETKWTGKEDIDEYIKKDIIGGASVYQQALPFADELCLTEIDSTAPEADAFFPEVSPAVWHEKNREAHPADEKHLCSYAFVDYVKA